MKHAHEPPVNGQGKRLIAAIVLNFSIVGVEAAGGLASGSLSLLSDALHNFSDAFSLIVSFLALRLAGRKRSESRTFGYKRAEILAALANSLILMLVSFYLFKAAVERWTHPSPVNGVLMMAVASAGLLANVASVLLLRRDSHGNLNIRASYLHLVSDAFTSFAVIVGGAFVYFLGCAWVDSLLTLGIGLFVLIQGFHIVNRAIHILMQAAPEGMDVNELKEAVESIPGVLNIHHVHVWRLTDREIHCEAHVNLSKDVRVSETGELKNRLEETLRRRFHVTHATFQFEFNSCEGVPLVKP